MTTPQTDNKSLAEKTAALAKEVVAEATSSGERMTDDDGDDGDDGVGESAVAAEGTDSGDPAGVADPGAEAVDPELAAIVSARDLDALAARLGIKDAAEYFGIKADDFKAIRHERAKLEKSQKRVETMETQLRTKYSDPVVARKAFDAGNLDTFFETVERWSGRTFVEVQKAWTAHVQGKPVSLPPATVTAPVAPVVDQSKIDALKTRITGDIKSHALAKYPGITDLVFDKMRAKWNDGVRTPAKALELVKEDLKARATAERKALQDAGVLPKSSKAAAARTPATRSPAQGSARTAADAPPASTVKMTDRELAQDVLRSLGKEAWRSTQ